MKPKIGILGVWHPSDSKLESDYNFVDLGRSHVTCPGLTPQKIKEWQDTFDLIIVAPFGYDACWVSSFLIGLRGGRCKLAMWSFDSHNPGWAQRERTATWLYSKWFTAHSFTIPEIGNASWIPCCYVWHGVNDLPQVQSDNVRWLDVASCSRPYYGTSRENLLCKLREYLDVAGRSFVIGECSPGNVSQLYAQSNVVLNVNQNVDLNIRFFEGLAANSTMLMTPANDQENERFSELKSSVINFDRMSGMMEFFNVVNYAVSLPRNDTRKIVQSSHMLFHRYCEIATKTLD
jgi:hypothetical protein